MRISNLTSLCSQIESTAAPSLLGIAVTLTVIKDTRTSEGPGQSIATPLRVLLFLHVKLDDPVLPVQCHRGYHWHGRCAVAAGMSAVSGGGEAALRGGAIHPR